MDLVETHIGTVAYRRVGAGAPLVLLHGGLSDGRAWSPQLESLVQEYDVVAWDAPGCGGSADPAADLSLADYADAVAVLVRALGTGFFGHSVPLETLEAARAMILDVRPAGTRSMLIAFANADLRAVLPTISVPTLLIYGAEDLRAPRGVAEALHAAIPGSRLMLVPATGHDVNLEAPQEYDAAVRAFLRMVSR